MYANISLAQFSDTFVLLSTIAYIAFIAGMMALVSMGRLARLKYRKLSEEMIREAARRSATEQARLEEIRKHEVELAARMTTANVNNGQVDNYLRSQPAEQAKVPWWKYEPRRK